MPSVTLLAVVNKPDRTIARFDLGGGLVKELEIAGATVADRRAEVFGMVRDLDPDYLCALMLALFLRRFPNPTAGQIAGFVGRTLTVDLTATPPVSVS